MRQMPLAIGTPLASTFRNFSIGANAAALAHLQALGPSAAPVYLWGGSGVGKSHLLEAMADRMHEQGASVGSFSAADAAPWALADNWSLALIDDCDRLDAAQQHAAFVLFVEAATLGLPVVATGKLPPVDLPLREDLRTRLGWGHVFAIRPLAESEARATLRRQADERGIFLSDDVMDYLLNHFDRDLKHLTAQLDRLDAFSLATQRVVTVPLLRRMLTEEGAQ